MYNSEKAIWRWGHQIWTGKDKNKEQQQKTNKKTDKFQDIGNNCNDAQQNVKDRKGKEEL